jgi:hypothetical protein
VTPAKRFTCRTIVDALEQIGLLRFLPRADGHDRKFRSPEYAAFQYELGPDFALLSSAALRQSQSSQRGEGKKDSKRELPVSGLLAPARTWDRKRPELRLPSKAAVKRAASEALEALQRLPLPALSPLALATLWRPPWPGGGRARHETA